MGEDSHDEPRRPTRSHRGVEKRADGYGREITDGELEQLALDTYRREFRAVGLVEHGVGDFGICLVWFNKQNQPTICGPRVELNAISHDDLIEIAAIVSRAIRKTAIDLAMFSGVPVWVDEIMGRTSVYSAYNVGRNKQVGVPAKKKKA